MRKSSMKVIKPYKTKTLGASPKSHGSISFLRAKSDKIIVKTESGIYSAEKIKKVAIEGYPKYF